MTIDNQVQLANTRNKLKLLEDQRADLQSRPSENDYARQLTLQSLQRWIKKLKEEILRYECRVKSYVRS